MQKSERAESEFALFPPSHTGNPVSEPKAARQGIRKGLEKDVQYSMLNIISLSIIGSRVEETEGKRQMEETDGRDKEEEIEGKRQKRRDGGEETG
jgi:hypothetical protein